jgi:hypothetical protein
VTVHPRSDWTGVRAADSNPFTPSEIRGTVIHWNGPAVPRSALTDPRNYLEGVRRYHTSTKGWSDIAYNLAVDQTGDVWVLRGLDHRSAANGGTTVNARYVAVLAILGQGQEPTAAVLAGLRQAAGMVRDRYPHAPAVLGHVDVRPEPTACPGPHLSRAIDRGDLNPTGADVELDDRIKISDDEDRSVRHILRTLFTDAREIKARLDALEQRPATGGGVDAGVIARANAAELAARLARPAP